MTLPAAGQSQKSSQADTSAAAAAAGNENAEEERGEGDGAKGKKKKKKGKKGGKGAQTSEKDGTAAAGASEALVEPPVVVAESYQLPDPGPYPPAEKRRNAVRFTPAQVRHGEIRGLAGCE